jgi:hypothetical protein
MRRRLRDDFAIGIDRAGTTRRADLDLLAFQRANLLPGVVPTAVKGWQQPQQTPQRIHFQAVDVQTAVVDACVLRYRHAATVVAAIANRNVDGARDVDGVAVHDLGPERPEP